MIINGVTVEPGNEAIISGNAYFFSAYALSSTSYVYNGAGGKAANDGKIPISGSSSRTIQYDIASPTGTVTLTIFGTIGTGAEIPILSIPSAVAIAGTINITEDIDKIRVGAKITAGSATITVIGGFKGMKFSI